MRRILLSIIFLMAAGLFFWLSFAQRAQSPACRIITQLPPIKLTPKPAETTITIPLTAQIPEEAPVPQAPEFLGEKIGYDVRFKGLSIGKAYFSYEAVTKLNGKPALLMTMTTKLARFYDKETIYGDPATFLPMRVERSIVNLLSKEKITEQYDQEKFKVSITKHKGGKTQTLEYQKDAPVQNPILLPHHVRQKADLAVGSRFTVVLPTRTFEIALSNIENVTTPAGTFKAYHFQSCPPQIEIWMTADARKIPVKLRGTGVLGYVMVMEKYHEANKQGR